MTLKRDFSRLKTVIFLKIAEKRKEFTMCENWPERERDGNWTENEKFIFILLWG